MRTLFVALALAGALASCGNQGDAATPAPVVPAPITTPCASAYPAGPYGQSAGDVLADATLTGIDEHGAATSISLHDAHACGAGANVLVLRVTAGFCGTCLWHSEHFAAALAEVPNDRVRLVDVLVRNADGEVPIASDLATWQTHQDTPAPVVLDSDGASFVAMRRALPRYLVVDPQTMKIAASLDNPGPEPLHDAIANAIAAIDGRSSVSTPIALTDHRFDAEQMDLMRAMVFSGDPPPDPTNRFGDRPYAFGRELFSDATLSPTGEVSCVGCHQEDRAFSDGSETATRGVGGNNRNTPSIVLAAWSRWQMWDGRADSLWMQALLPMEASNEYGSSRLFIAHRIFDKYKVAYQANFDLLPALDDTTRFPAEGMPGVAAYDAMSAADQDAVTQVFVNVGKAIAAFERHFRPTPIPVEPYVQGNLDALTDAQKDGLLAFFQAGCAQCHYGSRLTDDAFHAMRFPTGRDDLQPDNGRTDGIPLLLASEFLSSGRWSDAKTPPHMPNSAHMLGGFKTPALRGVAVTAPYGQGGSVPMLIDAVNLHRTAGEPAGNRYTNGDAEPWLADFSEDQAASITTFLSALGIANVNF